MFFVKTISLASSLPPVALLDRIRQLATGKLPMARRSRWRNPVLWQLCEQPDGIRLMPLAPATYTAQQPSFIGAIEPEGCGSRVRGVVETYAVTVWITAFLVLVDAVFVTASVLQRLSSDRLDKALSTALFGILFGTIAVSMLRLSVSWAAADIRQLLEAAADSNIPHLAIAENARQAAGAQRIG
jgi:hypothetical protein